MYIAYLPHFMLLYQFFPWEFAYNWSLTQEGVVAGRPKVAWDAAVLRGP